MKTKNSSLLLRNIVVMGLATMLSACSAIEPKNEERLGVAVQPLNYSGYELSSLSVEDPKNPKNHGGGAALNPYGGGRSSMCCFAIPRKWHPDLQVIVKFRVYPEKEYRRELLSVPPYAQDKPGNIWIMVHEGGSAEAVVSNYGPSRPEWPGKIKGYPEPSREYELKLWEREVEEEKAYIFDGTRRMNDPSFSSYTAEEKDILEKNIAYSKARLDYLLKEKP